MQSAPPGGPPGQRRGCPGVGVAAPYAPIIDTLDMESGRTLDLAIAAADRALRAIFAPARASRPIPQPREAPQPLSDAERRHAAALMRVNHTGELAAQALYHGQALLARSTATRALLLEAAQGESDHLGWCEARLSELKARPSLLNPLWYAGSFAIGALAALAGDRASLGFVAETEQQVERHLDSHLERLPTGDSRSRAILERMRAEEIAHGRSATRAGGAPLPQPVQALMRRTAAVMTGTAYWI
jgi:3-demethoxyubiquinol 3-hydroxylase